MNGTTLRIATAVACVAALAAPSAALAKKHHGHKSAASPAPIVVVPHDYDAGGNGAPLVSVPAGVRVNLFDPLQVATALGNNVLGGLGLPPVQLPTL